MKRAIVVLMVLTLALTAPAVAATPKVPKLVCFQYNTGWALGDVVHLTFKLMSTAATSAGKVKMYSVNGEHHWDTASFPVTGTAHLKGSVLHWNTTGTVYYANELTTFVEECTWDVTSAMNTATSHYRVNSDIMGTDVADILNVVDCTQYSIPYGASGKK